MEEQSYSEQVLKEETKPSMWKSAVTYGIYYAVAAILLSVILYATGMTFNEAASYTGIIVMIAAVVIIQLHYRKALGGYISYGKCLAIGIVSFFFAAIPVAIFTFILYKYVDPQLLDQMQLVAEEKLMQKGNMSQEQIDMALSFSSKFQTPAFLSASQLINLPFMALIIGLISSIFIKKQSPEEIFD